MTRSFLQYCHRYWVIFSGPAHDARGIHFGARAFGSPALFGVHAAQGEDGGVLVPTARVSTPALAPIGIQNHVSELAAGASGPLQDLSVDDDARTQSSA